MLLLRDDAHLIASETQGIASCRWGAPPDSESRARDAPLAPTPPRQGATCPGVCLSYRGRAPVHYSRSPGRGLPPYDP
jgi:hypothetical protein